jgi:hypothetical protein
MTWQRRVHNAVATVLRPTAATLFAAEVLATAMILAYPLWGRWDIWGRRDSGKNLCVYLWKYCAILAAGSLLVCLLLAILGQYSGDEPRKEITWCVILNLATLLTIFFLPAIQG